MEWSKIFTYFNIIFVGFVLSVHIEHPQRACGRGGIAGELLPRVALDDIATRIEVVLPMANGAGGDAGVGDGQGAALHRIGVR